MSAWSSSLVVARRLAHYAPRDALRHAAVQQREQLGQRVGDAAPMAIIELVSAASPAVKAAPAASTGNATSAGSDSAD